MKTFDIPEDEPVFVLRAQDSSACQLVQLWICLNHKAPVAKLTSAQKALEDMRQWKTKKKPD